MREFEFPALIVCPDDIAFRKGGEKRLEFFQGYHGSKYAICKRVAPKRIAEIGVRAGYAAWSFLQAAPTAKYIGFDMNKGTHGGAGGEHGAYHRWAKHILSDYDVELVQLDTQATFQLGIEPVDFFHVDGDHTFEGASHDFNLAFQYVKPGGYMLIDDLCTPSLKGVREALEIWLNEKGSTVTSEMIESKIGECLIRKVEVAT